MHTLPTCWLLHLKLSLVLQLLLSIFCTVCSGSVSLGSCEYGEHACAQFMNIEAVNSGRMIKMHPVLDFALHSKWYPNGKADQFPCWFMISFIRLNVIHNRIQFPFKVHHVSPRIHVTSQLNLMWMLFHRCRLEDQSSNNRKHFQQNLPLWFSNDLLFLSNVRLEMKGAVWQIH